MRRAYAREERPSEAALYEGLAYLAEGYGRFLDSGQEKPNLQEGFLSETTAGAVAENMAGRLRETSADRMDTDQIADLLVKAIRQLRPSGAEESIQEAERRLRQQLLGAKE